MITPRTNALMIIYAKPMSMSTPFYIRFRSYSVIRVIDSGFLVFDSTAYNLFTLRSGAVFLQFIPYIVISFVICNDITLIHPLSLGNEIRDPWNVTLTEKPGTRC